MKRYILFAASLAFLLPTFSFGQSFQTMVACWLKSSTLTTCAKPVEVPAGGTGLATLTNHALQVGAGTNSPTQIAVGGNGTVLIGAAAADPTWSAADTTTTHVLHGGTAPSFSAIASGDLPAIGQSAAGVDSDARHRLGSNTNDTASAGNIGELVTASVSTNSPNATNPTGNVYSDVSGLTLAPTAGDWDIDYYCTAWLENTTGGTSVYSTVALRSGSTTVEQEQVGCAAQVTDNICGVHGTFQTQTDGTKTYKLSIKWNTFSGSPTVTNMSCRGDFVGGSSYIRARRRR